jgi:single-stranded-DNA-specific exonuclease
MSAAEALPALEWELNQSGTAEARSLARDLGITVTAADLLFRRGHADAAAARRFLDPRLAELTRPDAMADRSLACRRLADAIRRKQRICVFGDYDCDGITSAAIMTSVLRALGGEVVPLLASRFDGGYGVSDAALERILAASPAVLVTCDCGSSDHASIARAARQGIDVIVIDHHLVPEEPLAALAFLNPHRPECGFPYKGMASCGLALSIAAGLRTELGTTLDVREWLDLVAIGTIADVAPLDGDNRALVRAGLAKLREGKRPGVRALVEAAEIDLSGPIGGHEIAFRIAPRINAPGRLGAPDLALELLLATSLEEARGLAARVEQLSDERRALQQRMLDEATAAIERESWHERAAIVVGHENWNHGIVGIVAGRLAATYGRPVIVVGMDGARGRGSVRGPAGSRLHDMLQRCRDVLVRFGGHQAAAGVEVEAARLGELREAFEAAATADAANGRGSSGHHEAATLIASGDDPEKVAGDLARFEPCGERNPMPKLAIEGQVITAREVRGGHLKVDLQLAGGYRLSAFAPSLGGRAATLSGRVTLVGQLRADRYRGGSAVELRTDAIL